MPSYFGQQTQTATDNVSTGGIMYWTGDTFTCPGSVGVNQNIQELAIYVHANGASNANIRLGVYDSAGTTLIAEGTARILLTGVALAWQGHMTQASVKAAGGVSPGILVGGTSYRLAVAFPDAITASPILGYTTGGTQDNYNIANYSTGLPTPTPSGTGAGYRSCIRCGVDPAGGGSATHTMRYRVA